MHRTISYAKEKGLYIILDVKRNDIGSTAEAYSKAYLGKVDIDGVECEPCPVDCVTVNPYLVTDGIQPFVNDCKTFDKAIFALVKTSNPSSGELQDLLVGDEHIYIKRLHSVLISGTKKLSARADTVQSARLSEPHIPNRQRF